MPVVISDASTLRYLILVQAVDVLQALYGGVLVPFAVRMAEELLASSTARRRP